MTTMSPSSLAHLTADHGIIQQIAALAEAAEDPTQELCGVILPQPFHGVQVVMVPKRADDPHTSFKMLGSDLRFAMGSFFEEVDSSLWPEVIFWHTHPGGGIGPSRVDLQNRGPGHYLVVAMTSEGPVPVLY